MAKTFFLCADDFGLNPSVSGGILSLARMGRLSAISCITNSPYFALLAKELRDLTQVYCGLHFNLTEGYLLSNSDTRCYHLADVLIKSHLGILPKELIRREFNLQLDAYLEEMGVFPAFIDGHQHVHHLPGVQQIVLEVYEQRLRSQSAFIRSTYPTMTLAPFRFKTRVLAFSGAKRLHHTLKTLKIRHNPSFAGIYDFAPQRNYRQLFCQWLSLMTDETLIMCHPGQGAAGDPIAQARLNEMNYFSSEEFLIDCHLFKATLKTTTY